jgi:hypothetical protein
LQGGIATILILNIAAPFQRAAEPILRSPTPISDKEEAETLDVEGAVEATSRRPWRTLQALHQLRILDARRHREFRFNLVRPNLLLHGNMDGPSRPWAADL